MSPASLHPLPGTQECWVGGQTSPRLWACGALFQALSGSQGWVLRTPPKNELSHLIVAEGGESPYPGVAAPVPPLFLTDNGLLRSPCAQARLGMPSVRPA